jgi:hypothetical protein
MMLFDTEKFSSPKPKSVGDLATAMGLTLLDYLRQEAEANNKYYGIGLAQRYELVGWADCLCLVSRWAGFALVICPKSPRICGESGQSGMLRERIGQSSPKRSDRP